jgi:sulfite exporter TauE/SafE
MELALLLAALALGLVSGVHCVGMCGGIVTAFSIQPVTFGTRCSRPLAFNAGRIATYSLLGLGTLPWLLAAGVAAAQLRGWMQKAAVRGALGATLLGFGLLGFARAGDDTRNIICF